MEELTSLLPPHLQERPQDGDPVHLARWYASGLHEPCVPGSGCSECWSTLSAILDVAEQIPIEKMENPATEKAAQDLLQIWYGSGSTRIAVLFPGLPTFSSQVPGPRS